MKTAKIAVSLLLTAVIPFASAQTNISVQYGYASTFKPIFDTLVERFHAAHPDIRVVSRPPYQNYEDGLEQVLRGAITGDVPDVSFQAINRQRVLVDRRIAQPLGKFIQTESKWEARGYASGLMAMGKFDGQTWGLPFIVSTPIVYYNADLVQKVGGDPNRIPEDWNGVLALASKINSLGDGVSGISYAWDITGNWMWQALVMSHGGTMMSADEKRITFNEAAGKTSIGLLSRMVKEGGMRNLKAGPGMQSFTAGKVGILMSTSAYTETIEKGVGNRFPVRTTTLPLPAGPQKGRLPGGGSAVMILSKQPDKQKAAWSFIKFVTSAESAAFVARSTGYAPANQLAASDPKYLGDFYKSKPNHLANMRQLSWVNQWYAFPGDNGLKITDVINDHLQSVVSGGVGPDDALRKMTTDVEQLLPKR
jgi:multiple sugar transport system substrate-binding protein